MNFDDELERRLTERANETEAAPDLEAIEAAAGSRRTRQRLGLAVGTLSVTGLVLVGVMLMSGGQRDRSPADDATPGTDPTVTESSPTEPTSTDPTSTDLTSTDPSGTDPTITNSNVADNVIKATLPPAADPVGPYLADTTEIYRRMIGDREIVVRRSEASWAELFDLEWRAPTGSAEVCFGDQVLFLRDTATLDYSPTGWEPIKTFTDFQIDTQTDAQTAAQTGVAIDQGMFGDVAVVRSFGAATEIIILDGDGEEVDRASFVDGLAAVVTAGMWANGPDPGEPAVVLVTDGVTGEPIPFGLLAGTRSGEFVAECTPGPPPARPLPPAGVPPDDPIVDEAEIRTRHALAVDRTVPLSDDPPDLVDDTTGIEQATAEVDAGQYADAAASAEHTIGELVFTAPDEAWFEYSITTPLGELPGRHGVARFNGSVWQITRDTICQDLATAGGRCVPESLPNTPPEPEGWAERIAEYERTANLYFEHQFCLPGPFAGGECVVEGGFADDSVETSNGD